MAQLNINTNKKATGLSKEHTHRELKQVRRACNRAIGRVKAGKELPVDVKRELANIGLDPETVTLATLESLRERAIGARALIRERKAAERAAKKEGPKQAATVPSEPKAATVPSEPKAATVPSVLEAPAEEPKAAKKASKKTTKKTASKTSANPAASLTRKKKATKKTAAAKKAAATKDKSKSKAA